MATLHGFHMHGQPSFLPQKDKFGKNEIGSTLLTFKLDSKLNANLLELYGDASETLNDVKDSLEKNVREAYKKRANFYLKQAINFSTLCLSMKDKLGSDMQERAVIGVPADFIQWHTLLSEENSTRWFRTTSTIG